MILIVAHDGHYDFTEDHELGKFVDEFKLTVFEDKSFDFALSCYSALCKKYGNGQVDFYTNVELMNVGDMLK